MSELKIILLWNNKNPADLTTMNQNYKTSLFLVHGNMHPHTWYDILKWIPQRSLIVRKQPCMSILLQKSSKLKNIPLIYIYKIPIPRMQKRLVD